MLKFNVIEEETKVLENNFKFKHVKFSISTPHKNYFSYTKEDMTAHLDLLENYIEPLVNELLIMINNDYDLVKRSK